MATPSSSSRAGHAERGVQSALLKAACAADDHAFSFTLKLATHVDLNAADASGRTVLGAVVAGNSWEDVDASDASFKLDKRLCILKMLLNYGGLSLYSLNAPQDALKGATPLSFAAWLNLPEVVRVLLEERPGMVTVDGMDSRGATPLMYAARDGSAEVVQCLLEHGARPDYRDVHNRTAVQYALHHPDALYLCESALRRHRAQEYISKCNNRHLYHLYPELDESLAAQPISCHPRLVASLPRQELLDKTSVLVAAILSQDIHQLDYLLFPAVTSENHFATSSSDYPFLVNYPDEQGWAPIHYCVSATNPSFTVLDMLYRAGADTSLFTLSGHGTPLHCIAYKANASTSPSIRSFIQHLVLDLRAPLSAVDHDGETCLHVAAELGQSVEVLAAFLLCDTTGTVRSMRNSRGLTALEIAQDRFKIAFGTGAEQPRSGSSASVRTIKPSVPYRESTSSLPLLPPTFPTRGEFDYETASRVILDNLALVSHEVADTAGDLDVDAAEDLLQRTERMGDELFLHTRVRLRDAIAEIETIKGRHKQTEGLVQNTLRMVGERCGECMEATWSAEPLTRSFTANSTSSDSTKVSSSFESETSSMVLVPKDPVMMDAAVSTVPLPTLQVETHDDLEVDDPFAGPLSSTNPPTPAYQSSFYKSLRPVKSMTDIRQHNNAAEEASGLLSLMSPWTKNLPRKRSKSDLVTSRLSASKWPTQATIDESPKSRSRTSRVRAWFRKKVLHEPDAKMGIVRQLDEEGCAVGREVKYAQLAESSRSRSGSRSSSGASSQAAIPRADLRTVSAAMRDIADIQKCIESAERYVSTATRSIKQADQLLTNAIEQRKTSLEAVWFIQEHLPEVELELDTPEHETRDFLPVTIPTSPRNSQLVFPRPPTSPSSTMSFSSTLIDEAEADDIQTLHRVMTQKLQMSLERAFDEVDKATTWLRIVREVIRGVRRRAEA